MKPRQQPRSLPAPRILQEDIDETIPTLVQRNECMGYLIGFSDTDLTLFNPGPYTQISSICSTTFSQHATQWYRFQQMLTGWLPCTIVVRNRDLEMQISSSSGSGQ
jgi:hypothetical protein